ncbi:MAG: hypothetical protein ABIJ92_04580 [Candidatus Aenigmatarchaeota archaeon]
MHKVIARVSMRNIIAAVTLFVVVVSPVKVDAKPPPIYDNSSVFTYILKTPTDGMYGSRTDFWVIESGASYKLPFLLRPLGTETSFTLMGLGGYTQSEGVPPAQTDFQKIATTTNIRFALGVLPGKFRLAIGARRIWVRTRTVNFIAPGTEYIPGGPIWITEPSQNMWDLDFGTRFEWKLNHKESSVLGFLRSARIQATRFDAYQNFRKGKWVFSSSVGLFHGLGFETFGDTKSGNVGIGADKAFAWQHGKYLLLLGGGYEFGVKSSWYYIGGKIGRVMLLPMRQSEYGDKSHHILVTVSL